MQLKAVYSGAFHFALISILIKETSPGGIFDIAFFKTPAPNHLFPSNQLFLKEEFC